MTSNWRFAATGAATTPLAAVREVLGGADEALLCTAFVDTRGVGLLRRELAGLGGRARLAATSTFMGERALDALTEAMREGVRSRVVNPGAGTFHPKVIVARHGNDDIALVGSTNLTNGLAVNVEAAIIVMGQRTDEIRRVAEAWWDAGVDVDDDGEQRGDRFEPFLLAMLEHHVGDGTVVRTVSDGRPNRVVRLDDRGVWIETDRSRRRRKGAELVPPWMVTIGWEVLRTQGRLTNAHLLRELRVHRSSAVCALLAALPFVAVASRNPIELRLDDVALAAEPSATYEPGGG